MKLKKIAIGVALAAGAAGVQASDVLLFPYVVSGGSVTTLVSVINTDSGAFDNVQYYNQNGSSTSSYGGGHNFLHWRYHIKSANTNDATCFENNGYFPTSPLDITTYDVSGLRGEGGVMFNDPSVNNNWKAAAATNQYNAITLDGQRAVLFVHNAGDLDSGGGYLAGEAMVVDFANGAAWGYRAEANASNGASSQADFNFNRGQALNTGVTFMPLTQVTTRFFVTPVNTQSANVTTDLGAPERGDVVGMLAANGLDIPRYGTFTTRVNLDTVSGSIRVLNRDEGGISGGVTPQDVVCVGAVNASDLITSANVLAYANTQGGWGRLTTSYPGSVAPTDTRRWTNEAVVTKIEFRAAGGTFGGQSMGGAFNNAFTLNPTRTGF